MSCEIEPVLNRIFSKFKLINCPIVYLIRSDMDDDLQKLELLSQSLLGCIKLGVLCGLYMPEAEAELRRYHN